MSWSVTKVGRAGKLAETIETTFRETAGAFPGAETEVKNHCGEAAQKLCAGMADPNNLIKITAYGSAWVDHGSYRSHNVKLEIEALGVIEE